MQNAKNERLTIRVTDEERGLLENKAEALGFTASEFIRHKIFEEQQDSKQELQRLQELQELQTRILFAINCKLLKMAHKQLTQAELADAEDQAIQAITKHNVVKRGN